MTRDEFIKKPIKAYMEIDFTFIVDGSQGKVERTETWLIVGCNYDDETITISPLDPEPQYFGGRTIDVDIRHLSFPLPKPRQPKIHHKPDATQ